MTKKQINAAINALIDQAGVHVKMAQEHTSEFAQASWSAHIVASMVCSSLVEALVAMRKALEEEHATQ